MRKRLRGALRAALDRLVEVEVIGQEECPLMMRWTFLDVGVLRAMIHFFPAEVSDRDPHDHPRSFVTFVLRGNYRDESWCHPECCKRCERVGAGAIRYRAAEHMHIVETDAVGCWTLVLMGPLKREWGFMRIGSREWWPWGKYIQRFGGVTRCESPPDMMGLGVDPAGLKLPYVGGEDLLKPPPYKSTPPPGNL